MCPILAKARARTRRLSYDLRLSRNTTIPTSILCLLDVLYSVMKCGTTLLITKNASGTLLGQGGTETGVDDKIMIWCRNDDKEAALSMR